MASSADRDLIMPETVKAAAERRIAAVVLPELLCEIAATPVLVSSAQKRQAPLGVVIVDPVTPQLDDETVDSGEVPQGIQSTELKASALLDAVDEQARRYGVREGQSIAEACALVSDLTVRVVSRDQVNLALGRIAELGLAFGPTVSIEAPDTVWIDISGVAHLCGGEQVLAAELASRVRALGHVARVAVASGPRLARAFARWAIPRASVDEHVTVVPGARTKEALAPLPITALPLERDSATWLVRLGVLTIGELMALPRSSLAGRLGPQAAVVLELCAGRDPAPLVAYPPPRVLTEAISWDEGVESAQPLLFALRGLVARLSGRLSGRGEAAQKVELTLQHDRPVARLRGVAMEQKLHFDLASPLWREVELRRVLSSRLERLELRAPVIGLTLEVPSITPALGRQLDLSRLMSGATSGSGAESLPVVLAELVADVGKQQVGVLRLVDAHRPEKKSRLAAPAKRLQARSKRTQKRAPKQLSLRKASAKDAGFPNAPTRLLPRPLPIRAALRPGATFAVGRGLYTIDRVIFEHRLDAVEWWSAKPAARDYWRLFLRSASGVVEALAYVDRESGARFLQAIAD
jgi:protein ImuB